jgi:hypothetical protein
MDIARDMDIIFSATELYFKAKALMLDDLPKPSDWIYYPHEMKKKWQDKKTELIKTGNYDAKTPLVLYMEIMMKWVNNHHMMRPEHSNSL